MTVGSFVINKLSYNWSTIKSRPWNAIAGEAHSKMRKLRFSFKKKKKKKKKGKKGLTLSSILGNAATTKLHRRPNEHGLANNKKSNKSYRTWEFKVARATWSACHVQLTFLSGMPVVSSVDEILCPRRWLSRGTRTNRKIFHCVSISNGEWRVERRASGGAVGEEARTDRCQRN